MTERLGESEMSVNKTMVKKRTTWIYVSGLFWLKWNVLISALKKWNVPLKDSFLKQYMCVCLWVCEGKGSWYSGKTNEQHLSICLWKVASSLVRSPMRNQQSCNTTGFIFNERHYIWMHCRKCWCHFHFCIIPPPRSQYSSQTTVPTRLLNNEGRWVF